MVDQFSCFLRDRFPISGRTRDLILLIRWKNGCWPRCFHSKERHVALLSHAPPRTAWRQLAKKFGKKLIHVPLAKFSQETIQQLRMFHVLNGQQVRSFAAEFIRKV